MRKSVDLRVRAGVVTHQQYSRTSHHSTLLFFTSSVCSHTCHCNNQKKERRERRNSFFKKAKYLADFCLNFIARTMQYHHLPGSLGRQICQSLSAIPFPASREEVRMAAPVFSKERPFSEILSRLWITSFWLTLSSNISNLYSEWKVVQSYFLIVKYL